MDKYIMVTWPDIQTFMEHPRFSECIFCMSTKSNQCPDCTYMVPEDLYNEVYDHR